MSRSIVEELRDARTEYPAIYMEIISSKKELMKEGINLIIFFEGKDDIKYYKSRLDNYLKNKKYFTYFLNGKSNVLELRRFLKQKNEKTFQLEYIVDKDFDNTKPESDLYVTPYYSIENFYISKEVFENIINVNLSLNKFSKEDKKDYDKVLELYLKRKEEYINALDEIMEYYYYQKINKVKLGNLKEVTSTNNPLIKVSLDKISKDYDIEKLNKLILGHKEFKNENILRENLGIEKETRKYFYRGKYLVEFLEKFTTLLFQDANEKKNRVYFSKKRKNSVNISGNILGVFSNCSETPECLIKFLERIDKKKI